jgi:cell division protein FtsB
MNATTANRERKIQMFALAWLLFLGAMALIGPYGLLAWSEQSSLLDARGAQISTLREDVAVLENRVDLLDPAHIDPDFAGELMRRNLNVAHPDEYVMDLEGQP